MQPLNFPACQFRFRQQQDKLTVFDRIRKKFVVLTPEEWVRQHVVNFLLDVKKYPISLVNVEKMLKVNGLSKRYDAVVFTPEGKIHILVECKAPDIRISQQTFDQIARYNLTMDATYIMVTNGMNHYFCKMDYENGRYEFLKELPEYTPKSAGS